MVEPEIDCSAILKVLADETRLSVVRLLIVEPHYVRELNEVLQIEPTLLSHHLRVLRDAAIVDCQRDGKSLLYSISSDFESRRRGEALDLGCCQIVFNEDR